MIMRALARGLVAFVAIVGFFVLVGFAPMWLIAGLFLTVAVLMARGSYRSMPPLYVPAPHAAFPDAPRDEWGTFPSAVPLEGTVRQPPATHTG